MSVKFGGKAPRVQHREYIGSVLAPANPADFNTTVYMIQPGLYGIGTMFPWGGSVFRNFEEYILHGGIVEFHTTSSNYSASSALGSVSMSTIYDAEAPALASLQSVNNNEFTTSAPPSASFYHPLECAPKDGATDVKFVRRSNTSTGALDNRFDDFGVFQISTEGLSAPAGTKIGDLWFSYDIELRKAVLPDLHVGTTAQFDAAGGSAIMNTLWNANTPDPENSLPATVSNVASAGGTATVKVQMPDDYNGNYLAVYGACTFNGAVWGAGVENVTWDSNGTDITLLELFPTGLAAKSNGFSCGNGAAGVSGTVALGVFAFSTIASKTANNYFQLSIAAPASTTGQKAFLMILPLDNDITDSRGLLGRLMKSNPRAAQLATLMAQYSNTINSHASSIPASMAVSRAESAYGVEELKEQEDLEASVHIDRKQLELLLSASSNASRGR